MKKLAIFSVLAVALLSGCASNREAQIKELQNRENEYRTQIAEMQKAQEKRELMFRLEKLEARTQTPAPRNQECKIFCF